MSPCVIYTLCTTYLNHPLIVQKEILNVLYSAPNFLIKNNGLIFQTNCSSIKHQYMKLGDSLQRKRGKNKHTCPMFDNDFLASSNKMKLCTTDYIFPIKQDDICDYNTLCFMSSGLTLDDIIMNIFTESTKNQRHNIRSIFRDSRMIKFTCTKDIFRIIHGKGKMPILKGHYVCIITLEL